MSKFIKAVKSRFTEEVRALDSPFSSIQASTTPMESQELNTSIQRKLRFSTAFARDVWYTEGDNNELKVLFELYITHLKDALYGDLHMLLHELQLELQQRNFKEAEKVLQKIHDEITN